MENRRGLIFRSTINCVRLMISYAIGLRVFPRSSIERNFVAKTSSRKSFWENKNNFVLRLECRTSRVAIPGDTQCSLALQASRDELNPKYPQEHSHVQTQHPLRAAPTRSQAPNPRATKDPQPAQGAESKAPTFATALSLSKSSTLTIYGIQSRTRAHRLN